MDEIKAQKDLQGPWGILPRESSQSAPSAHRVSPERGVVGRGPWRAALSDWLLWGLKICSLIWLLM